MLQRKLLETTNVTLSTWCRSLLVALICVAPIGGAFAQDQRDHDDQAPPEQHPQGQPQHPPAQAHPAPPPHPNATPPAQHPAPGAAPQIQHAVPGVTPQVRPAPNSAPPTPQVQPQRNVQHAAPTVQAAPQQPAAVHGNFQGGNFQGNAAPGHAAPAAPSAAFASRHGGAAPTQFSHGQFYGHDFAHFTPHDQALWHGGVWHHEERNGRYGWWYVVDGIWYFYDEPIYPYPTFIPDIVYIPDVVEVAPPPPPEVEAPPPAPAAASYYYYFCPDTQTYYPYVTSCASPWQQVAPTPPQ